MIQASSNSNNTYSMVRIESVLQDIYRIVGNNKDVTQDDLLESAASAMSHLYNYKLYERVMCIGVVENHNVVLPQYYQIDAVMYKSGLSDCDAKDLPKTFQLDFTFVDDASSSLNYCNVETFEDLGRVSHKCTYNLKRNAHSTGWSFMTLGHSIATQLGMASHMNSCNVNDNCAIGCEYTYSVCNNVMTVSPPCGYVLVVMTRTPRDSEGHPLIPVIPLVNEALRAYVMMEINEKEMNMHKEGALGLYRLYSEKWGLLSAAAIGELNKLTFPESIELVKDMRYFRDDSPFRGYDKSSFEHTNIGYTDRTYNRPYYYY